MSKSLIKDAITCYVLSALSDLNQPEITIIGKKNSKKWMTFDNYINKISNKHKAKKEVVKDGEKDGEKEVENGDKTIEPEEPKIGLITPIAISERVIEVFHLIFNCIVNQIEHGGKLHSEKPIDKLVNTETDLNFNIVKILFLLSNKKDEILLPSMMRNFNFDKKLTTELETRFKTKMSLIDPGASSISHVYLNFIKIIARSCSYKILFTQKRLTLNYNLLKSILIDMMGIGNLLDVVHLITYLDTSEIVKIVKTEKIEVTKVDGENADENTDENADDDEDEDEDAADEEEEEEEEA